MEEAYTQPLRRLMERADIRSFRSLAATAGVSEWAIQQIRRGRVNTLRLAVLLQLSQALGVPLGTLLGEVSPGSHDAPERSVGPQEAAPQAAPALDQLSAASSHPTEALKLEQIQQEYLRLQAQLAQQRQSLEADFQAAALVAIEAWLLQWPTAAYAAQQNPQAPAVRLIPLMQPLAHLLNQWGVRAIAPVGAEVAYDPQIHQLMEGLAQPGDRVRVRYTGYWHGEKLLHRAKVSPVT